jgi:hypothetical protein
MSVRPQGTTGRIFIEFNIRAFYENLSRKFKLHKNLRRITCNLHEDPNEFLIISRVILRGIRNVSDRNFGENKTRVLSSITLFRKACPVGDNVEKYDSVGQVTTDNMAHMYCMMDT